MLQAIGQYSGATTNDSHLHLRQYLKVPNNFKIHGVANAFRLWLFPYSLRDKAKSLLNSLEPNFIGTKNNL